MVAQPRAHTDRLTGQATRPKRRIACLAGIVFAMMVGTCGTGLVMAQAPEPSTILSSRIEHFFNPVRTGDRVTITICATRPGGLQELSGFFNRSQYLSSEGKNEHMISLTFTPTGAPDEFRTEFVVPAEHEGNPLPRGPYRLHVTGGLDGSGNGFWHLYLTAGRLDFDPSLREPWEALMTARYVPGPGPLKVNLELCARGSGERKVAYAVSVTNYFLQTVGEVQERVVTLPGEGEVVRQSLAIPVPGDGDQYRLKVRLKEVGGEQEQEFVRCLLTDVTAGYRRELRLESGDWQYLPVKDGAALMPQSDEWKPGRG